MLYDTHANFSFGKVTVAPSPATSGTTLSMSDSDAALFPDPAGGGNGPYNIVIWAANQNPLSTNAEVLRVTAKGAAGSGGSGNTQFTVTRTTEQNLGSSMSARSIQVGDLIGMNVTKKWWSDIETNKLDRDGSQAMTGQLSFTGTTNPGIILSNLTTTQRNALTPSNGMTLYNTTTNRLETYENGAWQQKVNVGGDTMTGSLIFNPSVVTSGVGVFANNSSYTTTVPNGSTLTLFDFTFHNTQTVNQNGIFSGIQITTDTDAVDTGAAIRLLNNGQSDALYIRVAGKSGSTASTPTGLGMDINRNGLNENATANNGYGIQIWDWSQTDTGNDTPTGLYLAKHNNHDTHHILLKLNGNRNLARFYVPGDGLYTGAEPLIDVYNLSNAQRMVITAHGDLGVGPNIPTLNIESWNTIGTLSIANGVTTYFDTISGVGRIVSQKNDFSNTGRSLAFNTLNNVGESARLTNTGLFGVGVSAPLSRLDIRGAISGLGGVYIDKISVPNNITVTPQGTTGATTYGYKVTIVTRTGETLGSTEVTITNGNATLTSGNFNTIAWPTNTSLGAEKYNIYRTTSGGTPSGTGFIGQVSFPTTTFNDTGLTASGGLPSTNTTGNVGFGVATPTALLHLASGVATTAGAPLKFNSGTNLTTPEAGAVEFDGSSLYFTPSTTRKTIAWADMSNLVPVASFSMASNKITNLLDPTNPQDAATKNYVDGVAAGLSIKSSVQAATAAALPANTYNNGSSGVGATLTGISTGALTVDGYTVLLGDRILVQNEVTASHNGIYTVTTLGTGLVAYVLTRTTDMNQGTEVPGAFTFVENGTANANSGFVCATTGTVTMGTTSINFTQFSGAGEIIAGTGLTKSGNTISISTAPVANGGTGQTSYTNGQILIGNTTGNTLAKSTLTAGNSIAITNGSGSIIIDTIQDLRTSASPTFASVSVSGLTSSDIVIITATGTGSLTVGRNGTTNPVFQVDTSIASAVTGILVKGNIANSGVAISVQSNQTNENVTFDAKGSGTISLGSVSTGNVIISTLQLTNALTVGYGGTGQTSYTDGQLLIGNTTGNTLTKSTLTAGNSITVTNGHGSITLDTIQDIRTSASPTFAGLSLGTGSLNTVGNIEIDGTATRDITVGRASSGVGVNQTMQAGGAQSGQNNLAGGQLILSSGISTGTGASTIQFNVPTTGSSGSTDVNPSLKVWISGASSKGRLIIGATTSITGGQDGLNFIGTNPYFVSISRHTTASTAGQALTIQAGGAVTSGTDLAGGTLQLRPGISTGVGRSLVSIQGLTPALSTGTGDNSTYLDREFIGAFKALTNNSAINLVNCTLASNTMCGGIIRYAIEVFDSTNLQMEVGEIIFECANKAGAFSGNTMTQVGSAKQFLGSGTLTVTWAISAANPAVISLNANSSLTPASGYPRVTYSIENFTQQAIAIQ